MVSVWAVVRLGYWSARKVVRELGDLALVGAKMVPSRSTGQHDDAGETRTRGLHQWDLPLVHVPIREGTLRNLPSWKRTEGISSRNSPSTQGVQ